MEGLPRPEHEYCELKGGTPKMAMMGGDLPVNCPSYCSGPTETVVETPVFFSKFGPNIPCLALTCAEAEQPKILYMRSVTALFNHLRDN